MHTEPYVKLVPTSFSLYFLCGIKGVVSGLWSLSTPVNSCFRKNPTYFMMKNIKENNSNSKTFKWHWKSLVRKMSLQSTWKLWPKIAAYTLFRVGKTFILCERRTRSKNAGNLGRDGKVTRENKMREDNFFLIEQKCRWNWKDPKEHTRPEESTIRDIRRKIRKMDKMKMELKIFLSFRK